MDPNCGKMPARVNPTGLVWIPKLECIHSQTNPDRRIPGAAVANRNIEVVVAGIRQLTPRIREYELRTEDGTPLPRYEPGAHIEVHTVSTESGPIIRHYSLIGGVELEVDHADTYRIAVQREDRRRGSAHIHDTFEVGTRLEVSWPKNNFPLDRREAKTLLIAGGIGITPIYAMLRSVVRRAKPFDLIYSGRSPESMAYLNEAKKLGKDRVLVHLSGDEGNSHLDFKAILSSQPDGTNAYACGPSAMIEAVYRAAKEVGWDQSRVRSELFSSAPSALDKPFDVELRRTGRTIHVGRDTTILDAITAANIPVLSDCRRGECGLCPLKVLESDGEVQHRDRYLDAEQKEVGKEICICVSRTTGSRLVLDA
ncbi:vanillate O-demethylase ferredoxin subunit [Paraburkholderia tuberum]|uniref:Vanillate O-demethylase ferredoxin subunit n=1 Tax=Paraburkholderia tuberum TaxID=157910 RepID=A0A1H1KFB0_9BURK|nr:vanillate O-demethylase ferredoxin subunit [Paraburkholderia tuberum]